MDAEVFGDRLFIAGDFTRNNGLCYFIYGGGVAVEEVANSPELKITQSPDEVIVTYEALEEAAHFRLFNLKGELLRQAALPQGQGEIRVSTANLASGTYVYQLVNKAYQEGGKLMVWGF